MRRIPLWLTVIVAVVTTVLVGSAISGQDKYTVQVPGGLAFSEFKGYENWQVIAVSHAGDLLAVILGNPEMIEAYQAGAPGNGKSFPDGAKMAKIHWNAQKSAEAPDPTTRVPGTLHDVDFMVKDGKRFADSGGWGWAAFKYDAASDTFTPTTLADNPPQGNDAKCGFACHTIGFALILVLSKAGSVAASEFATAEEAKAMLERAVAAVKEDKAKALDMFNNGEGGFKDRGLYVWCANASDGIITAQPYMNKGKQLQGGRASCVAFC